MRVTIKGCILLVPLLFLFPIFSHADFTETVETVEVRPGVVQPYLLLTPKDPVATVILFAGYGGYLNITQDGIQQPSENFLVRTREIFAKKKFMTVVVDVPSDFKGTDGILGWRATDTHAHDLQKIIVRLKEKSDIPVWLIGTSRGTISAANVAARIHKNVADGLVLTASVVEPGGKNSGYVEDVDLEDIHIPTLIVHHEDDGCVVCDFFVAKQLPEKLVNASRVEFISFSGGKPARSRACGPLSKHGFFGIEEKVVDAISTWIAPQY